MQAVSRPEVMISNAAQRFDAQGHFTHTTTQDLIRQLLRNLADWTRQLREPVVKT
jgi:chromate reductase, NAD(P)H dehydrogenase (quinone)